MKIEVGKTYKDQEGTQWYIEAKLKHPTAPYSEEFCFLSTKPEGRGWNIFNENGLSHLKYRQLQPNRVKKEGWVARGITGYKNSRMATGCCICESEEAIKETYKNALSYHKIEWEEEEQ